jgi:hypothetical protein
VKARGKRGNNLNKREHITMASMIKGTCTDTPKRTSNILQAREESELSNLLGYLIHGLKNKLGNHFHIT